MTEVTVEEPRAPTPLPALFSQTQPRPTLIAQGAEALLYRTHFLTPSHPCALKHRPSKPYRHPILDKRLTRHRILSEARTLVKCRREGVSVPGVLALDAEGDKAGTEAAAGGWMMMEWVDGKTVRDALVEGARRRKKGRVEGWEDMVKDLVERMGRAVGRLHEVGVVHGDLTTSNMMLRPRENKRIAQDGELQNGDHGMTADSNDLPLHENGLEGEIVLIDFGLAGQSTHEEDKAVDLYVLERAFGSTHPESEEGFRDFLTAYESSYKGAKIVLKKLEDVRMRGRKRSMLG